MKYKVGQAYIHDGSAESPLPNGSKCRCIDTDGATGQVPINSLDWRKVLCFVPTHIPKPLIERWAVVNEFGFMFSYKDEAEARHIASLGFPERHVVLLREVTK